MPDNSFKKFTGIAPTKFRDQKKLELVAMENTIKKAKLLELRLGKPTYGSAFRISNVMNSFVKTREIFKSLIHKITVNKMNNLLQEKMQLIQLRCPILLLQFLLSLKFHFH